MGRWWKTKTKQLSRRWTHSLPSISSKWVRQTSSTSNLNFSWMLLCIKVITMGQRSSAKIWKSTWQTYVLWLVWLILSRIASLATRSGTLEAILKSSWTRRLSSFSRESDRRSFHLLNRSNFLTLSLFQLLVTLMEIFTKLILSGRKNQDWISRKETSQLDSWRTSCLSFKASCEKT